MTAPRVVALRAATSAVLASPLAAQAVLDVGPGAPFATVNDALAAAVDGDTVRVAAGTYPIFQINGKGVSVVAATGATVEIDGTIRVMNVPAAGRVLLSGIDATGGFGEGLLMASCDGPVRVQDGIFRGGHGDSTFGTSNPQWNGWAGVRVLGCNDVAFTACELHGGGGAFMWDEDVQSGLGDGADALLATAGSAVVVQDSQLIGGHGGSCWDTENDWGGYGGHAIQAEGSWIQASGCTLTGGDGGNGCDANGFDFGGGGGSGGHCVRADGLGAVVVLDNVLTPGEKGYAGWYASLPDGGYGLEYFLTGPPLDSLVGTARSLEATPVAPEGSPVELRFLGEPGDFAWLALSTHVDRAYNAAWSGTLLLGSPWITGRRPVGVLPQAGEVTLTIPAPAAPGLGATTWHVQALFREPVSAALYLSPTRAIVSLDGAL